jgi:hypothetical protein
VGVLGLRRPLRLWKGDVGELGDEPGERFRRRLEIGAEPGTSALSGIESVRMGVDLSDFACEGRAGTGGILSVSEDPEPRERCPSSVLGRLFRRAKSEDSAL